MRTAKEIKEEISKLFTDPGFFDQDESEAADRIHRIYEPYLKQCCKYILQSAANRAKIKEVGLHWDPDYIVDKESITETPIVLL